MVYLTNLYVMEKSFFGINHSKYYKPSVVSPFLEEKDDKGRLIRRHSDVYLLLRQERLQKSIGVESLRAYISQMASRGEVSPIPADMSDDDLFNLIEPKDVDNLTDAWKFGQYLNQRKEELTGKYNSLRKHYTRYQRAVEKQSNSET